MKVGKAKYGSGKKVHKVEKGGVDNVYRILPPLGKLADAGKWYTYYRVEWGYKNSKGQNKPFLDVRVKNFKTSVVEVESAAHLKREALKKNLTDTIALFRANQATKEQVTDAKDLVGRYNLDAKYYMNAVNLKGEIGLLKLNSTQMKTLRAEIEKLTKQGVDPLAIENGIFFNFTKSNETGKLQDWVFGVTPYLQNQADGSLRRVTHTMDDAFIARLASEAYELSGMYPEITPEQVEQLVKAGDNHAALVDELLGAGDDVKKTDNVATEVSTEVAAEAPLQSAVETTPVADAAITTPAPTTTTTAPVAETVEAAPSSDMSDEAFLMSIGANE